MRIDILEHAKYIMSIAVEYHKEFPTISLIDILQELNLLVIEMSENGYDPKYKATTFIKNFPGQKLRQVLIYKYINFRYDEDKNRIFMEQSSIDSKVTEESDSPEYGESLRLVEAGNEMYGNILDSSLNEFEIVDLISHSNLDSNEKKIMFRRLGINSFKIMTLEEIGNELGITKEWVRKLEGRAIEKLKKYLIEERIYGERE